MNFPPQNHSSVALTVPGGRASSRALTHNVAPVRNRARGNYLRYGAAVALLLVACCVEAQEPDRSSLTNPSPETIISGLTNEAMQVDELISAIRSLAPADAMPEDASGTNGPSLEPPTNEPGPGTAADDQSWRRPSGRESRSRWSSRQRSNSAWSSSRSGSVLANSTTNSGPVSLDYSAFRLVVERNIFDPNRRPNYRPNYESQPRGRDPEYFALVGTMSYAEGTFAFFNGSSTEYQASVKSGGSIAGYKVAAVGSDSVKLALGTNQLDLRIGMQMRRDEDGSWFKSEAPTSYTVSSFEPPPASNSASPSGNAASGAESEILKRLMEKRERE